MTMNNATGRIYATDPGAPYRQTDSQAVKKGGIWKFDGLQPTLTMGNGDVYWFIDTTAASVTVTLPDAADTVSIIYTVKRKSAGVNTLTVATIAGDIDGAATKALTLQYDHFAFTSDGTQYWIIG